MAKDDNPDNKLTVEVAYALPARQRIIRFKVVPGTTALEAVKQSGITREFPEIEPDTADMGIFAKNLDGKLLPGPAEYVLKMQDRVEIYRALQADPKAARAQRAAKAKKTQVTGKQGGSEGDSEEGINEEGKNEA